MSHTTRPPRDLEVDGKDYYFVTEEEMQELIDNNQMLEWTEFNGWYYGTSKQHLTEDNIYVGVFNPDGIISLLLLHYNTIEIMPIYIYTSDKERLIRSLNREQDPDIGEIIRRYGTDKEDFENIPFEHYVYENSNNKSKQEFIKFLKDFCPFDLKVENN